MGARFEGYCYASNAEAVDAYYSAALPYHTAGSTSYRAFYEKSTGGVWQLKRQSISSSGTITNLSTTTAPVPAFPACDESESFYDGMTIGWGVALAMVVAWSINVMRRGL